QCRNVAPDLACGADLHLDGGLRVRREGQNECEHPLNATIGRAIGGRREEPVMHDVLSRLGLSEINPGAWTSAVPLPMHGGRETLGWDTRATGETLARITLATKADLDAVIEASERAFVEWRKLPAPRRGEIV